MCQTCIGCGKCTGKAMEPLPSGTCPKCGWKNDLTAQRCDRCGILLPLSPGTSRYPRQKDL